MSCVEWKVCLLSELLRVLPVDSPQLHLRIALICKESSCPKPHSHLWSSLYPLTGWCENIKAQPLSLSLTQHWKAISLVEPMGSPIVFIKTLLWWHCRLSPPPGQSYSSTFLLGCLISLPYLTCWANSLKTIPCKEEILCRIYSKSIVLFYALLPKVECRVP